MTKGIFQSSSDALDLGDNQVRPRNSQMGAKGEFQYAGADYMETNENAIDPPYSNLGPKGEFQMGGADMVDLSNHQRETFAFSQQGPGSKVEGTGKS